MQTEPALAGAGVGVTEELLAICAEMRRLLPLFEEGDSISGLLLPTEHEAAFTALAIEAKSIIGDELGPLTDFSLALGPAISGSVAGYGPSYATVQKAAEVVQAANRAIQRKRVKAAGAASPSGKSSVDPTRIIALQALAGGPWDFARLVELCREINVAAANRCHLSTAMLLRTILNHVPPVLGMATFAEVATNYGGPKSKSFRATMQRLEGSLRNIADMHLHSPIRSHEDVPSAVQVDFAAELDVLLGEVIRVGSQPQQRKGQAAPTKPTAPR